MSYGEMIRLGDSFDGDSQLSTSFIYSDAISAEGKVAEIQIWAKGAALDSDDVEVYQFNSLAGINGNFDTEGKSLGTLTLDGDTPVFKSFNTITSRAFKIGLRMASGSSETPAYKGDYTINSGVDNTRFS